MEGKRSREEGFSTVQLFMMGNQEVQLETEEHPKERRGKSFAKRHSELSCAEQGETQIPWLGNTLAVCRCDACEQRRTSAHEG